MVKKIAATAPRTDTASRKRARRHGEAPCCIGAAQDDGAQGRDARESRARAGSGG